MKTDHIFIQRARTYTYKSKNSTFELFKNLARGKWELWQVLPHSKKYIGSWKQKAVAKAYLIDNYETT